MKTKPFIYLVLLVFLTIGCTTGESPEPASHPGTLVEIGEITLGGSVETRVNIINTPATWQPGDELTVTNGMSLTTTTYTYNDQDTWKYTSGAPIYMEDYADDVQFAASHGNSNLKIDQSTDKLYFGSTYLKGILTLTGRTLAGSMAHQKIDVVTTLTKGNGWTSDAAFAAAIADFKYKSTQGNIIPYRVGNTFRAQMANHIIIAAGNHLFTVNGLNGTYTLPDGSIKPSNGQRLTLNITYHKSGGLTMTEATVSDFTNADPIPQIPAETKPE